MEAGEGVSQFTVAEGKKKMKSEQGLRCQEHSLTGFLFHPALR